MAQVFPQIAGDLLAAGLGFQGLQQQHIVVLVAAATGEDALDQGGNGDHVFNHERFQLYPQGHVFHRHLQQPAAGVGHVLVEAGHIVGGVVEDLGAVIAETGDGIGNHGGAVLFPVGRIDGDILIEGEVRRSQKTRQLATAGAAQHIKQEQAVGGGHITDPEQGIAAGLAENVRHPEVVAFDIHLIAGGIQGLLAFPVTCFRSQ